MAGFFIAWGFICLGRVYDDKDVQERIIRRSQLDWVIVRPVILTDGPKTNAYRALVDPRRWTCGFISRADVADFLVKQIDDDAFLHKIPVLHKPMRRWRFFRNSKVKFVILPPKTLRHPGYNREMIMSWRRVTLARCCSAYRGPRYKRSRALSPSCRYYEASCRMRPRACTVRSWDMHSWYKMPRNR